MLDAGPWPRLATSSTRTIAGIEDADAILLVGANPRIEASLVNVRIRKRWRMAPLPIGLIGERVDLTYPYDYLGAGPETLAEVAGRPAGLRRSACRAPSARSSSSGQGALNRPDGLAILSPAAQLAQSLGAVKEGWNGFSRAAHRGVAGRRARSRLRAGAGRPGPPREMAQGGVDVLFNLGADEIEIAPGAFVIYQGTHGDRGAHRADVILPGAAYTEKSGTYVNTEGRVQLANRAAFAPGDAREDWAILRALSDVLGHRLPFDSLAAAAPDALCRVPAFRGARPDRRERRRRRRRGARGARRRSRRASRSSSPIGDFYLTNPIARASGVMAECSALARGARLEAAE